MQPKREADQGVSGTLDERTRGKQRQWNGVEEQRLLGDTTAERWKGMRRNSPPTTWKETSQRSLFSIAGMKRLWNIQLSSREEEKNYSLNVTDN